MRTLKDLIKKRINGVIAILKEIENTQTRSTAGILLALLVQPEPAKTKKPLMVEKKRFSADEKGDEKY